MKKWFKRSPAAPQEKPRRAMPLMMALEPRIMFDASVAAVADHVETAADSFVHEAPMPTAPVETDTAAREIVFIDSAVSNYENLVASLPGGVEVVILDAGQNGFAQIAAHLQGRSDITTIDIISHGDEGYAYLAGQALWADQLDRHAAELARIGEALTSDGDIRFFACNTGDGADGQLFVSELARLTGADVAASTDATGNRAGENWALEVTAGSVATAVGIERANLSSFNTSLATITVTSTDASSVAVNGQVSLAEAIQAANGDTAVDGSAAGSGSDVIVFHSSLAGQTIRWSSPSSMSVTSNITINGDIDGDGVSDVILSGDVDNDGVRDAGEASGLQSDGGGALTVRNLDFRHFSGNAANGVIRANAGSITIEDSVFRNNAGTVINSNTAIGSTVVVRNTLIHDNDTSIVGFTGMSSLVRVGGSNNHILENVVLVNNTGTYGAAGTVASGGIIILSNGAGSVTITNSTIANNVFTNTSSGTINTGGIGWALSGNSGAFTLQNNIVVGNTVDAGSANLSAGTSYTGTTNLVDTTVDFVNTGSRDYRLASTAANAIDQGTLGGSPATDLRGFNRPRGSGVDLGAYEVLYSAAPVVDLDTGVGGNNSSVNFSGTAVAIVPNVDISQSDGDTQVSGTTLSLTGVLNGGDETLSLTAGQITTAAGYGITVSGSGSTAMSLAGVSSLENYEAILALIQYNNANVAYTAGTRSVAVDVTDDMGSTTRTASIVVASANVAPAIANLNADTVTWAGVSNTVTLDNGGNASLTDAELGALDGSNGDWSGASLSVQRAGTAISADTFAFNTTGALFSVFGNNLQSSGQTFATFTNTGGVLTINFNSAMAPATTALVNDVARHISYRNDTPSGDATIRFTLSDGSLSTTADVSVASDSIYVTNTTDTATINVANGVSFSEAVAIAAADATGSQTIVFSSSLAATALSVNSVSLNESLTFDMDAASGISLTTGTITLGAATTQTFTNGTTDTAAISSVIAGSGSLTKAGAGGFTLSGTNTYSGATTISAGTLTASGGDAIATASSVAVASGATFALSSNESVGNLSGAGAITLGSNTLSTRQTADTTFSGGISGTGGLNVNQTSAATFALTLTGTNTFTGASTLLNFGWLRLNGDASYSNSSALSVNGSSRLTLLSDQTVGSISSTAATASLDLGTFTLSAGGDNTSTTVAGVISGTGNLVKQGSGTLTLEGTNTYTGTTILSAGTLAVASDSNLGSNSLTLASGATLDIIGATTIDNAIALSGDATVSTSADATLSGAVSGANTLTKAGASTLTLSNTNTYAATSVSAGTLSVVSDANLGSGTVTLASGSTLAITGATTIDNAISLTGNATVRTTANATLSGVVSGTNDLTKAGASTLTLSNTNTYAATTVSAGTLSVAGDNNLGSGTVTLAAGTTLALTGVTTIDNAIALTGNAAINTTANATLSGVISGSSNLSKTGASALTLSNTNTYGGTTTVSAGTLSIASDSNLGSGGVTLAAGTTLAVTGATTIDNAVTLSGAATVNTTADATLSGNIGGAGSLAKTGANTLTLSGTNSYAGTTTVSGGTLSIASDGNLGSSTVTLATGTTLGVTGPTTIDNAMALSGNAIVQAANAVTLSGAISGAGGLSKTGAGTVTLSGSNGFTGNVAVAAGGLTLSGGAAIDNNSAVTMSSGTTLTLSSSETIGSLAGAGDVALGANTLTAGGDNTSTSYSGNISGTGGGITKTGAGTLTLFGTNSNTGATTLSAGAIDAQNGDAIGDASAVSVASGASLVLSAAETIGSLAGAGTATLGANTLTTGGNNASTTFSGALTGSNGMVKTGSGTLTLSNTGNESTLSGGMTISAGTVSISDDDQMADGTLTLNGGTLSLDGPTVFDNNIDLAASSTINSGGNAIASGVISGAGDLTKTGSLSLQLTNTNTYTGATFVNAGYLLANNANSLGTTAGATTVASGATLYLSGSFTLAEALNLAGTGVAGNGAIYAPSGSSTLTGLVTLTGNTTLVQDGNLTFSGGITDGAGSYSLTKSGTGTLTLSGTASYDGSTTLSDGGLSIGSDSHIGSGALTLATGTTLAVTGATTIDNAVVLSGGTATVNTSANATLSGNITGAGGLTKAGASTLTLSGADSYTGATGVNAGTLLVNGALSATSATTVASGATLGGTGSIDSNVTVNSGGTLSPGNGSGAGAITVNGNLTMAAGSTLAVEIDGATAGTGHDQIIVNGTVDVSGATLSATHGYVAGSGDTYNIIVNDAADAVTGSFSGLSEGATVTAGGNSTVLTASYIGATGNDITLTAPVMPVVTGVSAVEADGLYNIGDTVTVAVNFSEQIFLSTGTIQLTLETGGTDRALSYLSGSGSSTLYFSYTVQEGDISADLDYTGTTALAANGDTIQGASFIDANLTLPTPGAAGSLGANKAIVVDGVRPTASIVVADTALAVGETSTVTITFSEAVSGLAADDFTVANGALSGVTTGDGGITWTATLTPTAAITDTSNLITLNNTGVADAAGNTGTGTTDSNNYAIDTARPTASIVVADTALAAGETSTVTITFSEAVNGLAADDFTVANGALSGLFTGDGGVTWTATLTPTAAITDTSNLITLDNTGVVDAAGNTGTGTTDSNNYAIDTARPTASIVVADTALAAGETSTVTITFSEAVNGLAADDFTVANGALSGLFTGDGGVTWTATLTPTALITDTSNLVTLNNTGVMDAAGNTGTGTTDSNNYAIDTARPTASIVVADTALAAGETSTVTITFSEAVSGLAADDFTVVNGALSGLFTGDGGVTWTATLTPTASVADTSNLITLNNTGVVDAAGNTGTGTTDSNNYAIDTARPTASIVVADTALAAGETSTVTITFSEAVAGLTTADLAVANGVVSGLSTGDGGITWTATLTPTASLTDTTNVITLDNTGVVDAAGNTGTGTTDSNNYAVDTTTPAVTSVAVPAAGTYLAGQNLDFTVNLSEAVVVDASGGTPSIAVTLDTGGTAQATYVSGSGGTALTFRLTVASGQLDGTGIAVGSAINLNGGTLRDLAGNDAALALNAVGSTSGVLVDAIVPTVASVGVPADGAYNAGDLLSFTVNTSETVTVDTTGGTPRLALDLGGTTVYANYLSGSGSTALVFQYTVQTGDNAVSGLAVTALQPQGGTLRDGAGNDLASTLAGLPATGGVVIDSTAPGISGIVRADLSPTSATSVRYTVSFSEAVSGLDASDFTLTTTASVSGSIVSVTAVDARTYTVLVGGVAGAGQIGLNLNPAATGIVDTAGNALVGGLAGVVYDIRADAPPAPVPPVVEAAPPPSPSPVDLPPTPNVTLSPMDPITPVFTPTLNPTAGMAPGLAGGDGTPGLPSILGPVADSLSFAPAETAFLSAAPATPARTFIELGAAGSPGLRALPDVGNFVAQAGAPLSIGLPSATFIHSDSAAQLSVEVRLADGRPLPAWLKFDPTTGTLSGQPPRGLNQKLVIEIIARDSKGNRATSQMEVNVRSNAAPVQRSAPTAPPAAPQGQPGESRSELPPLGEREIGIPLPGPTHAVLGDGAAELPPAPGGRAGLNAQFERHGQAARQAESAALLEHLRAAARRAA